MLLAKTEDRKSALYNICITHAHLFGDPSGEFAGLADQIVALQRIVKLLLTSLAQSQKLLVSESGEIRDAIDRCSITSIVSCFVLVSFSFHEYFHEYSG